MNTIKLNEEVVQQRIGSEADVVKQALRGHATEYERRAEQHNAVGATRAGHIYSVEALVLRNVLKREFGDD